MNRLYREAYKKNLLQFFEIRKMIDLILQLPHNDNNEYIDIVNKYLLIVERITSFSSGSWFSLEYVENNTCLLCGEVNEGFCSECSVTIDTLSCEIEDESIKHVKCLIDRSTSMKRKNSESSTKDSSPKKSKKSDSNEVVSSTIV